MKVIRRALVALTLSMSLVSQAQLLPPPPDASDTDAPPGYAASAHLAPNPVSHEFEASGPAPTDSCDTFRLDREPINPFNPDNPQYVPVRFQHEGNCFAQAVAGLVDYDKALRGRKPSVLPEYLSSLACDWTISQREASVGAQVDVATALYNDSPACDLSELNTPLSAGLDLGGSLLTAFGGLGACSGPDSERKSCASDLLKNDLRSKRASSRCASCHVSDDFIAGISACFARQLEVSASTPSVVRDIGNLANFGGDATTEDAHRLEATRCELTHLVLKDYCQAHLDPDKRRLSIAPAPEDSVKPDGAEKARCSAQIKGPADVQVKYERLCEDQASRAGVMQSAMHWLKAGKAPVALGIDNMTGLFDSASATSVTIEDTGRPAGHALLLIGQERAGTQSKCGYWLRNSWGPECRPKTPTADYQCDAQSGHIWISRDLMISRGGASKYYLSEFGMPSRK